MIAEAIPDVAGEIVGYRAWYVEARWQLRPPRLESLNGGADWGDGPWWPYDTWMLASCSRERDGVPHEHCGCGIHAARDRAHLCELGYNEDDAVVAIGEVALAGRVIPGDRGWRAEKARPLRFWLPHVHWPLVRRLREAYRVPVGVTNVLKEVDGWT